MGRKIAPHKDMIKEVSIEVAKEMGLDPKIVEPVVLSEFQFVKQTVKSGSYRNIKLFLFGTFGVHEGTLKRKKEAEKRRQDADQ